MLELITRFFAAWRERRWDAIRRRRADRFAADERRRADRAAYEVTTAGERLELTRELLVKAQAFAASRQGQWATSTYGRWPIVGWLEVGNTGRLWFRGERHWFGSIPDKPMDTPEALAANFTTGTIRTALRLMEPKRFWGQAVQEELLHYLGFRGRPI